MHRHHRQLWKIDRANNFCFYNGCRHRSWLNSLSRLSTPSFDPSHTLLFSHRFHFWRNYSTAPLSSQLGTSQSNHTLQIPLSLMNVLVYDDEGVSANSCYQTIRSLRALLGTHYSVQSVNANALTREPWEKVTAMLVIPGGRSLPYHEKLEPVANARIRAYVKAGGRYMGLCAGGYYGCHKVRFEVDTPLEVITTHSLHFFPGEARGSYYSGFTYNSEAGARAVSLSLIKNTPAAGPPNEQSPHLYYNGGGCFEEAEQYQNTQILARYPEGDAAIVLCRVGSGYALLSGLHFEFDGSTLDPTNPEYTDRQLVQKLRTSNDTRLALVRRLLETLGLRVLKDVSELSMAPPPLTPLWLVSSAPALLDAVKDRLEAVCTDGHHFLSDGRNSFQLYWDINHYIKNQKSISSSPSPLPIVDTSSTTDEATHDSLDIILSSAEISPEFQPGPFSLEHYFKLRRTHWPPTESADRDGAFGSVLIYGETVTSTQTILEKNTKFTGSLPDGLVFVATRQVSGRGRGGNIWISPPGCLPFSLLLRQPANNMSASPVFIQYLAALAVVDAVRSKPGYSEIPLRIKWPNDIYGQVLDDPADSQTAKLVKIGGVLVSSSFQSDEFQLVVGCGINTSNPTPTVSVNQLVEHYNAAHGTSLAPFSLEEMLAIILARLDTFYREFQVNGFAPFLELYYRYWLHSNQLVTLTDQDLQLVRITGITSDYGLLETVAVNDSNEVILPRQVFSLQPDGNSFDMMKGFISKKIKE